MFELKTKCLYCNHELSLNWYQRFVRPLKWIKCPSCEQFLIFDLFAKVNVVWSIILAFGLIAAIMFFLLFGRLFIAVSVIAGLLIALMFLYLAHLGALKLKKIGSRDGDKTSYRYEMKWCFVYTGLGVVLGLVGAVSAALFAHFALGLTPVRSLVSTVDDIKDKEAKYKEKFLPSYRFHSTLSGYLQRKDAWKQMCESGQAYYCRLLSAIYFYEDDTSKEKVALQRACDGGNHLGCYRLYIGADRLNVSNVGALKSNLTKICLEGNNDDAVCCDCMALKLYEKSEHNDSFQIAKQSCLKRKEERICLFVVRRFPFSKHIKYHKEACDAGVTVSCEALELKGIQISKNSHDETESKSELSNEAKLFKAVKFGFVNLAKELILNGVSVNAIDDKERSLLHVAVLAKNVEMVKMLIGKGARVNVVNKRNRTPLMLVADMADANAFAMFELLLASGAEINIKDRYKWTALDWSVRNRDIQFFEKLLSRDAIIYGKTLLLVVTRGYNKKLELLLKHVESDKLLHKVGILKLIEKAILKSSRSTVEILLNEFERRKIDLSEYHDEILILAHQRGDKDILRLLADRKIESPKSIITKMRIGLYKRIHSGQGPF